LHNAFLPPNTPPPQGVEDSYSVLAKLLPFTDQPNLARFMNTPGGAFNYLNAQRVALYVCPSEINAPPPMQPTPNYGLNYAPGLGDWLVWDYINGRGGNGAFPEVALPRTTGIRLIEVTDGTSLTIGFAEVKAFSPFIFVPTPLTDALPASQADLLALNPGPGYAQRHEKWASVDTSTDGVTFTFPPNTSIAFNSYGYTIDPDFRGSGAMGAEYAAMAARSFHRSGVNAAFVDGSVRFITDSIAQLTWRALGTRNGGEPLSGTDF
jgi:prepilin-type processing-associated H-X9-DG protein